MAGVESCIADIPKTNKMNYSEYAEDPVYGIGGYQRRAYGVALVKYQTDAKMCVYSRLYDSYWQESGYGVVRSGNVLIYAYKGECRNEERLDVLCQSMFNLFLEETENVSKLVYVREYCVSPYYYREAKTLVLVNFSDDDWDELNLTVPKDLEFSKIRYLQRDGQWGECQFARKENKVQVFVHQGGTKTLVLQFLNQ